MRMWGVKPNILCRKHLLGEHLEIHMFVGTILADKSIKGYLKNKLLDTRKLKKRHKELVREMKWRGYKHKSSLPKFFIEKIGAIDIKENKVELFKRCKDCRKNIKE